MATNSPAKKRRLDTSPENAGSDHAKKLKREKEKKKRHVSTKGTAVADDGEFTTVKASLVLSVAPVFASNPRAGVEEMLDSLLMRYIPALRGIVLSHSNASFLSPTGSIQADCPFMVCNVAFDATVWSPQIGMKLVGKVNLCSPDHISLLVHRTFNASIPRHHIPTDQWEFEYGPAANDPEFGPDTAVDDEAEDGLVDGKEKDGGRWVHKVTGDELGGPDGDLVFTIIGLTVANEMLSLVGSIQEDPFSKTHTAHLTAPSGSTQPNAPTHEANMDDGVDEGAAAEDSELEDDPFQALGRKADEAAAAKQKKEEKEKKEKKEKSEKKRKRKSDIGGEDGTQRGEKGEKKAKRKKS